MGLLDQLALQAFKGHLDRQDLLALRARLVLPAHLEDHQDHLVPVVFKVHRARQVHQEPRAIWGQSGSQGSKAGLAQ
jgi:hypothetical protein